MEFSDHTSRMTHDPTTVTAPDQSFINIHHPIIHLSILTHPERVEPIIKLIGVFRYLHQSFGLLTFVPYSKIGVGTTTSQNITVKERDKKTLERQ